VQEKKWHRITSREGEMEVNCYLFEEKNELTLIDTGFESAADEIMQRAYNLGKPITKIVLTHAHIDHVGSINIVKLYYPEAKIYASKSDAKQLLVDPELSHVNAKVDHIVSENEAIGSLITIATPGHTAGSLSYYDGASKVIVTGDAVQSIGDFAVLGMTRKEFVYPTWATWNMEQAIESARKIYALNPSQLLVGHGDTVEDPKFKLETAIEEAEYKLYTSKK
jgi:glyoxylase-like metal-dependent hydrolase (beta-lactamase superfamily II)